MTATRTASTASPPSASARAPAFRAAARASRYSSARSASSGPNPPAPPCTTITGPVTAPATDRPARANSPSSVAWGSSDRPVWTSDGWMIVLDGATSQPKRSDGGSSAIAPPSGLPAATRTSASRCARTTSADVPGASAASLRSSRPTLTARKSRWRQNSTTPALKHSPRSTRGHHAQDRVGERARCRLGHVRPPAANARALHAPEQILDVCLGAVACEPARRHQRDDLLEQCAVDRGREPLVRLDDRSRAAAAARARRSAGTAARHARPGRGLRAAGRARRRGRSATAGRARSACSGCAGCGRRWW